MGNGLGDFFALCTRCKNNEYNDAYKCYNGLDGMEWV